MSKLHYCDVCGKPMREDTIMCPECRRKQTRCGSIKADTSVSGRKALRQAAAKLAICLIAAIALLIPLGVAFMAHGLMSFIAAIIASIGYTAVLIYLVFIVHWLEPEWI